MRIVTINVDIFHRMAILRMLYSVTLTLIFKVNILNVNISETMRASVRMRAMTVTDDDIRHRMPHCKCYTRQP